MEILLQPFTNLGLNMLDVILILIILFYIAEGIAVGFIRALLDLLSFALSFILGLRFYSVLGNLIIATFALPQGYAHAIGFFLVAFVSELLLGIVGRKMVSRFSRDTSLLGKKSDQETMQGAYTSSINHFLGFFPALISIGILLAFLLSLLMAFPLSPMVKKTISGSKISTFILGRTQGFEKTLNGVFGLAIQETLTFLTIEPDSNDTVTLNFKVAKPVVDQTAEQQMLQAVNKERQAQGLSPLVMDTNLRKLAREYATDMFQRGYFSHNNPEGFSPFDRMAIAGITYRTAGENLALAPNVDLAMQGLMNSPGHKANILSPNFGRVGIGVMDGGIYGEMFVQEFAD